MYNVKLQIKFLKFETYHYNLARPCVDYTQYLCANKLMRFSPLIRLVLWYKTFSLTKRIRQSSIPRIFTISVTGGTSCAWIGNKILFFSFTHCTVRRIAPGTKCRIYSTATTITTFEHCHISSCVEVRKTFADCRHHIGVLTARMVQAIKGAHTSTLLRRSRKTHGFCIL
jgi:hypothetical protein